MIEHPSSCAHCGLPITSGTQTASMFCCHACRFVAGIVGRGREGEVSWDMLRLGIGSLLAMNIMMISLLLYTGGVEPAAVPHFRMVLLTLAIPAMAILLYPYIKGAMEELRDARMSTGVLIAGGTLAAFLVSAVNTVRGHGHIYFDTATMLPVLVTVGSILESTAKTRAAALIRAMETLLPRTALRMTGEISQEVPIDLLCQGDLVRVLPGHRIPVDGVIREGSTSIEEAAFTGEPGPVSCGPGDRVIAGTVNGAGPILVVAERTGSDVLLNRIIILTQESLQNRAEAERIAEAAARIFVPAVILLALGAGLYWVAAGDAIRGGMSFLAVLVVACPCTVGIATPLATSLAIARAARAGVVVRGGDIMERVGTTEVAFFDKTGTLTDPTPSLHDIILIDPCTDEAEVLGWLASLEAASEHSLARGVREAALRRGIEWGSVSGVTIEPGGGLRGTARWREVVRNVTAGTARFTEARIPAGESREHEFTEVVVAWDGQCRGVLRFTASPRPEAADCVAALKEQGVGSVIISGDRRAAASAVGEKVGVERVVAPCTPDEKLALIAAAVQSGKTVAMVGDGINDAPALAAAHLGIALGALDLPRQSGNILIVSSALSRIPWLMRLSTATRAIIRQNFAWSFGYNAIALAAASAGMLHPLLAAAAMAVSSVSVIANSMRIRNFPDPPPRQTEKGKE